LRGLVIQNPTTELSMDLARWTKLGGRILYH